MFPLCMPALRWKRQWHARSVEKEPSTNMSGWVGQRVSWTPSTLGSPRPPCTTYLWVTTTYINAAYMLRNMSVAFIGHHKHRGGSCPPVVFSALPCSEVTLFEVASVWPAIVRMWVCVTESQRDPTRAAIIRQNYAGEKERERVRITLITEGGGGWVSVAEAEPLNQCCAEIGVIYTASINYKTLFSGHQGSVKGS